MKTIRFVAGSFLLLNGIFNKYPEILLFDRYKHGSPQLPLKGNVKIEIVERATWSMNYSPPNYDITMHIYETFNDDRYTLGIRSLKKIMASNISDNLSRGKLLPYSKLSI